MHDATKVLFCLLVCHFDVDDFVSETHTCVVFLQEVLTTRWQDKYPRGGLLDGDRSFPERGYMPNGRPNGVSGLFPSAIIARGHSQHFRPLGAVSDQQQQSERPTSLSLPQVSDARHQRSKFLGLSTGEASFAPFEPVASRSSLRFGATMRNSLSVHQFGEVERPHLGHATEVRNYLRSRQGSSRSNRGAL